MLVGFPVPRAPVPSMRPRCSVYIATSLDGFISRPDGALDWLPQPSESTGDFGYAAFMADIDAMILGRATYEVVVGFGAWPFGDRPTVVLSRGRVAVDPALADRVIVHPGPPRAVLELLAARGCRHAYVDGGATIQSFLSAGLVDSLTITIIPVLLGAGRPLFGALPADVALTLVSTRAEHGLVQSTWHVRAPAP